MDNATPIRPSRRSVRLRGYDYSRHGVYFLTICTQGHVSLLGAIDDEGMTLSEEGVMVQLCIFALPEKFPQTRLHAHVIMPNHVHIILEIKQVGNSGQSGRPQGIAPTVGKVIGAIKSTSTCKYITGVNEGRFSRFDKKLWQRGFHDHIIRDEPAYLKISEYIENNPMKWLEDKYYAE